MQAFDASSIIYAWDNYPVGQFPPLWNWLADQIESGDLAMCKVAFDQVAHQAPDCAEWLNDQGLEPTEVGNDAVAEAARIKGLLGIVNDQYHAKGVDEEDLLIIAAAKTAGLPLVSNESKQQTLPDIAAKRKIPAVCDMQQVAVPCISFVEYFKQSKVVFG